MYNTPRSKRLEFSFWIYGYKYSTYFKSMEKWSLPGWRRQMHDAQNGEQSRELSTWAKDSIKISGACAKRNCELTFFHCCVDKLISDSRLRIATCTCTILQLRANWATRVGNEAYFILLRSKQGLRRWRWLSWVFYIWAERIRKLWQGLKANIQLSSLSPVIGPLTNTCILWNQIRSLINFNLDCHCWVSITPFQIPIA